MICGEIGEMCAKSSGILFRIDLQLKSIDFRLDLCLGDGGGFLGEGVRPGECHVEWVGVCWNVGLIRDGISDLNNT